MSRNQQESDYAFDALMRHVRGFYEEGMPLVDLCHRLRTESKVLVPLLIHFLGENNNDTKHDK